MFFIPDEENERNLHEFGTIPGGLSLLAFHSTKAEVTGLKDIPPDERPPVALTFVAFRIMVGLGFLFVLLTGVGWLLRNRLEDSPWYLRIMLLSIPLPYLAAEAGWIVTEVGRQPWIVYKLMKTSDAVSPIATTQVLPSLISFVLVYSLLGCVAYYLIFQFARKGPEPVQAGA
jgi:cytochrome d ubiquinol oxidase subunit I